MLIGDNTIHFETLKSFTHNKKALVDYVEGLVPKWAKHIPGIVDNQRYYIALHLRNVKTIDYTTKMEMVEALVDGIHVRGSAKGFVTIHDVIERTNKQALIEVLRE